MKEIILDKVMLAYSGKAGHCCCGCSGKYSYASKHRVKAGKNRGYTVSDDSINDRGVKIIVNKMNKMIDDVEQINDTTFCLQYNNRMYIAEYTH